MLYWRFTIEQESLLSLLSNCNVPCPMWHGLGQSSS